MQKILIRPALRRFNIVNQLHIL